MGVTHFKYLKHLSSSKISHRYRQNIEPTFKLLIYSQGIKKREGEGKKEKCPNLEILSVVKK